MDAFDSLEQDHRKVESLFKQLSNLGSGRRREKKALVSELVRELAVHSAIEEQLVYPAIRSKQKSLAPNVLESLEEHLLAKWTLTSLDRMPASHERYDAKIQVLQEIIEQHVEEEETELFPKARKAFTEEELRLLTTNLERLRKFAPTRPHPHAPDTPPGNYVAGAVASVVDRARDFVGGRKKMPVRAAAKTSRIKPKKKKASTKRR
jgi:hemerythrin superfamily protein